MKGKPGKTIKTGFGNEAARPVINQKLCTRCGLCVRVCKSFTIIEIDGMPIGRSLTTASAASAAASA